MNYEDILKQGSSAKKAVPPIVMIYGPGGIGKTTFAASAPSVVALCAEDGMHAIAGPTRLPGNGIIGSWDELMRYTEAVAKGKHGFQTIVADSVDCIDTLCVNQVTKESGKPTFEKIGWGKDEALAAKWRQWLVLLEHCRNERGMMVILIAHVEAKTITDPTIGTYSGFAGKMNKKVWGVTYNWADIVLFAHMDKALHEADNGKARAMVTGARVLRTVEGTGYEAKQRVGYPLPPSLPLDFAAFADALKAGDETPEQVRTRIDALLTEIADEAVANKARVLVTAAASDVPKLRGIENGLKVKLAEKNKEKAA